MMICCNQKEIFVFDERDSEVSKMLRRVASGHNEEITLLEYDYHLSMIATGCINGEIALYDFELSKIEGLLRGHTGDITALKFLSPRPVLISAAMDSTVCIWAIRPCPVRLQNVCLKRFENVSIKFGKDFPTNVTKLEVWDEKIPGIKYYRRLRDRILPANAYRDFENNWVFAQQSLEDIYLEEFAPKRLSYLPPPPDNEKFEMVTNGEIYNRILNEEEHQFFITMGDESAKVYNDHLDDEVWRTYLYLGDEAGFLKLWDLTSIISKENIKPMKRYMDIKTSVFNAYRQERVDNTDYVRQLRAQEAVPLP